MALRDALGVVGGVPMCILLYTDRGRRLSNWLLELGSGFRDFEPCLVSTSHLPCPSKYTLRIASLRREVQAWLLHPVQTLINLHPLSVGPGHEQQSIISWIVGPCEGCSYITRRHRLQHRVSMTDCIEALIWHPCPVGY